MTQTQKGKEKRAIINPAINYVNESVPAEFYYIDTIEKRLYGLSTVASVLAKHTDAVIQKMPSLIEPHEEYGLLQLLSIELSRLDDELISQISGINEYFEKSKP